jgi:hypothetical protein
LNDKPKTDTKDSWTGESVEVLGPDYEEGKPERGDNWRGKLRDRKQMLGYLETADRYWYAAEGFGSERRKNPA